MTERVARRTRDPIVIALSMALREVAERRELERAERRRRITVVDSGTRGGAAA
jgi:hypothetical protein